MGCPQSCLHCSKVCFFAISFMVLVVCNSSQLRFLSFVEGRRLSETSAINSETVGEEKTMMRLRAQIGSRPPRCEGRCAGCGHCEAIQVPTGPQTRNRRDQNGVASSAMAYARREGNSNYKPMSWKCKCGNIIFNP